jgi:hypothetical protein
MMEENVAVTPTTTPDAEETAFAEKQAADLLEIRRRADALTVPPEHQETGKRMGWNAAQIRVAYYFWMNLPPEEQAFYLTSEDRSRMARKQTSIFERELAIGAFGSEESKAVWKALRG